MSRRLLAPAFALAAAGLLLSACAQESAAPAASSAAASAAATTAASTAASAAPAASSSAPAADSTCAPENLTTVTAGQLTIGTDSPAYPPYFVTSDETKENGDPTSGEGFESAVAYKVAEGLGFTKDQVKWEVVPFNSSYAPGDKNFDFDVNQISITPERAKVVDFSDGYYTVNQAVVALNDSPIAKATTLAELQKANLGAQVGTTSAAFIDNVVKPENKAQIFNDTNDAKSAMQAGQIDGLVVDLPTAFYITAAEIENSKIVGQFQADSDGEQFGLLFQKGNPLVTCVNQVLADLKASGELQKIQDQWLAGQSAPYFKQ